jgi:hypothetical protein
MYLSDARLNRDWLRDLLIIRSAYLIYMQFTAIHWLIYDVPVVLQINKSSSRCRAWINNQMWYWTEIDREIIRSNLYLIIIKCIYFQSLTSTNYPDRPIWADPFQSCISTINKCFSIALKDKIDKMILLYSQHRRTSTILGSLCSLIFDYA